jgi:site-specific recombinase XerD
MTRRTNPNKLTVYRRHAASCPVSKPTDLQGCECPLWIHGRLRGRFVRQSLDTRSLAGALAKRDELLAGKPDDPPAGGAGSAAGTVTLEHAEQEFLKSKKNNAANTLELYQRAVAHFRQYAEAQGLTFLSQIDTSHVRDYLAAHGDWKRNTAQNRLVHLRVWFNYCRERRWIVFSPAKPKDLNRAKTNGGKTTSERVPFTPREITRILAAADGMPEADRARARALILLLLYAGQRISDATFCERAYLTPRHTLDYRMIKGRRPIPLPPELQQPALDALAALEPSRVYFFQPDREDDYCEARQALREGEDFTVAMPAYEARLRETTALVMSVLASAGISGACHRFRDTFAVNLLVGGADIYTVSKMLGHSDVRITDQHYMKLVPGYRELMSPSTRCLSYQFPPEE